MSRGPDIGTLLARALVASGEAALCPVEIVTHDMTRWASATFTGARHLLTLKGMACEALAAWVGALPDHEFAIRGHLVADLLVAQVAYEADVRTIRLEVLTVEEG